MGRSALASALRFPGALANAQVSPAGVTHIADNGNGGAVYSTGTTVGVHWDNTALPSLPPGVTAGDVTGGYLATQSSGEFFAYFIGSDGYLYQSANFAKWQRVSPPKVTHIAGNRDGGAVYSLSSSC